MHVVVWIIIFIASYALIYYAADEMMDNLRDLAENLHVSPFLIGLLILGIDPEESIASLFAGINKLPYIAVGNVVGNSIIAISLCFALPALFYSLNFKSIPKFYPFLIILGSISILLGFFLPYGLLITGIINLGLFTFYLIRNLRSYRQSKKTDIIIEDEEDETTDGKIDENNHKNEDKEDSKKMIIAKVFLFFVLILVGGEFLILAAENILILTPINESFFGFIIIAFMTNVEEILLMIKAIQKNQTDIGIGGMIGKLIWNIGFTYGISAIISISISINLSSIINCILLLISGIYFYWLINRQSMSKKDGILLFILFILFFAINSVLF